MNSFNELANEVLAASNERGFNTGEVNVGEKLMLITSELSEALDADRADKYSKVTSSDKEHLDNVFYGRLPKEYTDIHVTPTFKVLFEEWVKDSFEDELADAQIRLLELAALKGVDLDWHVRAKMNYNTTRPFKHGGKKY